MNNIIGDLKQGTRVIIKTHGITTKGKIVGIALLGDAPFGRYYIIKLNKKINGYTNVCEYANKLTVIESRFNKIKNYLNSLLLTFKNLVYQK